ncbi:MAG: potassium transporter [Spirochaetales bacterium]|nr:potassium transporter [Spirochaetales bacterium]
MRSEIFILLSFFISLILIGTVFLLIPVSWNGTENLSFIDALFTSASAVCVTGLITVDTALYSRFGQIIILLLIQTGGLGLISFSTLYIVIPSRKISLKGTKIIKEYFIDSVEYEPKKIIRFIVFFTLGIEAIGAIILYFGFSQTIKTDTFFCALFHAVSAFCNAGFSLFSNNLEDFSRNGIVSITIMALIVFGGIGFIVLWDNIKKITGKKKHLSLHTKMVLAMTGILILTGGIFIFFMEFNHSLSNHNIQDKIIISFFQSITPRTAGFNTIRITDMHPLSQLFFIPFMFIGGSPGSISGGIKVTTLFIIILLFLKNNDEQKGIIIFKRRLPAITIYRVTIFFIKAAAFLLFSFILFSVSEFFLNSGSEINFFKLFFESTSAFGTVGLSLGITAGLSVIGKIIIIVTMLLGRVGLLIIMMNIFTSKDEIIFPKEEVLIGS